MTPSGVGLAVALVLGTRLMLATGAVAQSPAADDASPPPPRLELGGAVGVTWFFPTVGLLASVPATDWLAVEATVNRGPEGVLSQGQLRIPIVRHRPTRRSLVVGLGHISGRSRRFTEGLLAHAGVSFQQAVARRVDLRLDLQMLMPFQDGPAADAADAGRRQRGRRRPAGDEGRPGASDHRHRHPAHRCGRRRLRSGLPLSRGGRLAYRQVN
jgi:hypothetical protein